MTVQQLIEELSQYDLQKEVYISTYYIEDDYDWDENLSLSYHDTIADPIVSSDSDGCVIISGEGC